MKILIVCKEIIPARLYGGVERMVWYLGRELAGMGHEVTFLVKEGSSSNFARISHLDMSGKIADQVPDSVDLVHYHYTPEDVAETSKPYLITIHGNRNDFREHDRNAVFVSKDHASRFGSDVYVYNGLDWNDYTIPDLSTARQYFHFLGKAAWRVKNLQGAIDTIKQTRREKLKVLGGLRFNMKMGWRFTLSPRVRFYGMTGGNRKDQLLNHSKGLIYPVRWHEPFGLALIESLYFGCPVFGTPYGALPELINSEVGYLSNSAASLADAIENSADFSPRVCHEYARDRFNSKKMTVSYLDIYERVLAGKALNEKPPKLKEIQHEKFLEWSG
jgi:glycosyltransferase involved in cell wall biosynthesis